MAIWQNSSPGYYSWTVPAGVYSIRIGAVGAGGGGSGGSDGGYQHSGPGGYGGGAGAYGLGKYAVTPGTTIDGYIGAGGAGGISHCCSGYPGFAGGTTSVYIAGGQVMALSGGGGGAFNLRCNDGAYATPGTSGAGSQYGIGGLGGWVNGPGGNGGLGAGGGGGGPVGGSCVPTAVGGNGGNGHVQIEYLTATVPPSVGQGDPVNSGGFYSAMNARLGAEGIRRGVSISQPSVPSNGIITTTAFNMYVNALNALNTGGTFGIPGHVGAGYIVTASALNSLGVTLIKLESELL